MTDWKVGSQDSSPQREVLWHESHDAYRKHVSTLARDDKEKTRVWPKTVWPPTNASELGLEKRRVPDVPSIV